MSKSNPTGKFELRKSKSLTLNLVKTQQLNFADEIAKLQQRLSLLREEYVKLQKHCETVEKDRARLRATSGIQNGDHDENDSFVANILKCVASMLHSNEYR